MRSRRENKVRSVSSTSNKRSEKKELPRKAAKIRRTFPEPGVEKTELRFVMYCESGGKYKPEKFLGEVADFFQEQAKRLAEGQGHPSLPENNPVCTQQKPRMTGCTKKCPLREADPEPGILLVKDVLHVKERHHEQNCPRARAIRASLPVIRKLIERIKELKQRGSRNKEIVAILKTAEQIYEDAEKCLASGGVVGDHISDRISRLNQIANTVLSGMNKGPRAQAVQSSSSVSNVNAVSHGDSSVKIFRRWH